MASTILIIEDEAEIADTLRYAVDSEGMQSIWASQGRLGLALCLEAAMPNKFTGCCFGGYFAKNCSDIYSS